MIELELVQEETKLLLCCIRYRVLQVKENQRLVYKKLEMDLQTIGLFTFKMTEAVHILVALQKYYEAHNLNYSSASSTSYEVKYWIEVFHNRIYEQSFPERLSIPRVNYLKRLFKKMGVAHA